jgi:poly(3-hydroxybutyrate) depolymerase
MAFPSSSILAPAAISPLTFFRRLVTVAALTVCAVGCDTMQETKKEEAVPIAAIQATSMATISPGWSEVNFPNHPTWVFMPSKPMPTGKHALMLVLHGCNQIHDQFKEFGNLEKSAEARGVVVAIPDVGPKFFGGSDQRCWDYNNATDSSNHIKEITEIATTLAGSNNIDPKHVYVVGLSSGAAMALDVGCKSPDVFAGVGSIAGPSVGSSQIMALDGPLPFSRQGNVQTALDKCKSLAGSNAPHFDTQITNIAFGDMDNESPKEKFQFHAPIDMQECAHAGQVALVSVDWAFDNVKVVQKLYGAGNLDPATPVQGGFATEQVAKRDDKERIAFVTIKDVGHAWPAGDGNARCIPSGSPQGQESGVWISQRGMNYPEYITEWLTTNNVRGGNPFSATPQSGQVRGDTSGRLGKRD